MMVAMREAHGFRVVAHERGPRERLKAEAASLSRQTPEPFSFEWSAVKMD